MEPIKKKDITAGFEVTARITGTGSYLPEKIVHNHELEGMVNNFNPERARETLAKKGEDVERLNNHQIFNLWAKQVTGIEERRYYEGNNEEAGDVEYMAAQAAKQALETAEVRPGDVDLVVAASFTPHFFIPNLACSTAHFIGAGGAGGFTLNTACSGFIDALGVAYYRIKSGEYKTVVAVAAERLTKMTNYDDPTTAVLFADGAGAAVLQASNKGIRGFWSGSSYSTDHIVLKENNLIEMGGGPLVQKRAINAMEKAALSALAKSPYGIEDIDYVIPHQANLRIIQGLAKKLGLELEKFCVIIEKFGNNSGTSVAIALDLLARGKTNNKKLVKGDKLLLTSVGGGYTLSGLVVEY